MPSSINFGRVAEVLVAGSKFILDDFTIEFRCDFDADPDPNQGQIKIYNLSENTINQISKNQAIILNAGYRGDVGTIFSGGIVRKQVYRSGLDKILQLDIGDASDAWLKTPVNKSYRAGITAREVIKDLLNILGLEIGDFELVRNVTYTNGRVISGALQTVLRQIVVNDCNTKLHISNGVILIRPVSKGTETGFLLNADSGLVASPSPIDDENNVADFSVTALLNHRIKTDSLLRIESKTANGNFIVLKGRHIGSNSGDFLTEMEVAAI